jgi:hypothetical protein
MIVRRSVQTVTVATSSDRIHWLPKVPSDGEAVGSKETQVHE